METTKWISVEERLPELPQSAGLYKKVRVIVAWGNSPENVAECTYCEEPVRNKMVRRWRTSYGLCNMSITHWMPLPSPPDSTN